MVAQELPPLARYCTTTFATPVSPSLAVAVTVAVPVSGVGTAFIETVGGVQSAAAVTDPVDRLLEVKAAVEKPGIPRPSTAATRARAMRASGVRRMGPSP